MLSPTDAPSWAAHAFETLAAPVQIVLILTCAVAIYASARIVLKALSREIHFSRRSTGKEIETTLVVTSPPVMLYDVEAEAQIRVVGTAKGIAGRIMPRASKQPDSRDTGNKEIGN